MVDDEVDGQSEEAHGPKVAGRSVGQRPIRVVRKLVVPLLQTFRTFLSLMHSKRPSERNKPMKMAFFDISRARFDGKLCRFR